eukprot:scaffold3716_cov69-Cylindrotheca_fusiformis.AAC.31
MEYLTFSPIAKYSAWHKATRIHENVRKILHDYDFIVSVERIVAMQLLLGLEAIDVLYLPSKKAGGKTFTTTPDNEECVILVQKSFASDRVANHLASDEWYAKQYGDYVLIEAVKQNLDLTIESIGKEKFQRALDTFLELKPKAFEECLDTAQFPCSSEGVLQTKAAEESCYRADRGADTGAWIAYLLEI